MDQNEPNAPNSKSWRQRLKRLVVRVRSARPFISGVLAAFAALLLYRLLFPGPQPLTTRDVNDVISQVMASATVPPAASAQVYQAIQPSLVLIQTEFPGDNGEPEFGLGSGVVVTDLGDILTSLHVVEGSSKILLTFADGAQSGAIIVSAQPENDIAVLRALQLGPLIVPATLGSPYAMRVGDEAFVVGNPLGLYSSMSAGVISGFDRTFEPVDGGRRLSGLIQIDAAVNPGNSGGPLLNRYGEVVGIIAAIVNPTGQDVFIGIGFAVPIDVAGGAAGLPPD